MDYVRLGRSSLKVSRIALGAMGIGDPRWRSWVLTEEQARPVVQHALESGITLFDTCDYYSGGQSEIILGRLLREMARREEIIGNLKAPAEFPAMLRFRNLECTRGESLNREFSAIPPTAGSNYRLSTIHG